MHDTGVEGGDAPPSDDDLTEHHAHRFSHYEEAAKLAMAAHPLPGENIDTPYLEDAQMWLGVYTELLAFKETLLRDTGHALAALSAPGREEVGKTDKVVLDAEARRFRQRLSLWERRCEELAAKS
ncbi:MAG: hypothetical protein M3019_09635 [Candidatus Dormibacteraeota bacterium]|nr:hypothetical protein [Candidatus Dormibacteraeota bacterium]